MLILYPNYSLEIVGNYLAFPFQVVLLVSFKSNLFWLKFLHYEVFNVQCLFQGLPALSELLYCIAYQGFCQELFSTFRGAFSVHFHASHRLIFRCFLLSASLWQLDYLTKDITSCQRIFASFFTFFWFLFYVVFTTFRRRVARQGLTLCKHLLRHLCRKILKDCGAAKIQAAGHPL